MQETAEKAEGTAALAARDLGLGLRLDGRRFHGDGSGMNTKNSKGRTANPVGCQYSKGHSREAGTN
jgi:hypothetical protein